jgi:hypothetical protein
MLKKFRKYRRRKLILKIAAQDQHATREQLIQHYDRAMIMAINQETKSESAMLGIALGVLALIDPTDV